jgi:predicted hydrocarbon binding protein
MATSASVDALLPLSFLEAVRTVDSPAEEEFEAEIELVGELRNKRLGLSETVYMQIKRYSEAVRKNQRTALDEAAALAKLIGRRRDAEAVFKQAGIILAGEAYRTVGGVQRHMLWILPNLFKKALTTRHVRRLADRYFNGQVTRSGSSIYLEVAESVTVDSAPRGSGCAYYEAGLRELLRLFVNSGGVVEHVRCESRGEGACRWRAEWRPLPRR